MSDRDRYECPKLSATHVRRKPIWVSETTATSIYGKPEIFNSDQGSQYTAKKFIDIILNNDAAISMDSKGRAIDNIFIERFWRTIKYEEIYPSSYSNIKEARVGIENYIHKYNNLRLHSSLNYDTPMNVYREYFEAVA